METKDYVEMMCKTCVNCDVCSKTRIVKIDKSGIIICKCPCYKSNYQKKSGFIYKNQLFQY